MTRSIRPTPSIPTWFEPHRIGVHAHTILSQLPELRPIVHDQNGEVHVLPLPHTYRMIQVNAVLVDGHRIPFPFADRFAFPHNDEASRAITRAVVEWIERTELAPE